MCSQLGGDPAQRSGKVQLTQSEAPRQKHTAYKRRKGLDHDLKYIRPNSLVLYFKKKKKCIKKKTKQQSNSHSYREHLLKKSFFQLGAAAVARPRRCTESTVRTDPSAETQRPSPPRLCSAAPRGPKMAAAPPPACCPPAALALHAALPRLLAQLPRPPLSLRSALSPHRPEPSAPLRTAPHHDGSADPACSRLPPPLPNRKRKFAYRRRRYQHCSITPRCAAPRPPSPPGFPLPSRVASATHTALCSSAPLRSSPLLCSPPLPPLVPWRRRHPPP